MARLLALFVLVIALGPVQATLAIRGGQPDGNNHPYVALVTDFATNTCSGVAISPSIFLTAAHCFATSGQNVWMTFDPDGFFGMSPAFRRGQWYPDPAYCLECGHGLAEFDTHDLAVVVLRNPLTLPRYAQLPALGAVDTLPNKAALTVVGYGMLDRPKDAQGEAQGFRRYYATTELSPSQDVNHEEFIKISANEGQDRGGSCFGDSGGPILLGDTVMAVVSYGTNQNCAGLSYGYRLDTPAAQSFIGGF
jgi:secreted trypsin-like serine protease